MDGGEESTRASLLRAPARADWADDVFRLAHEAIRWDMGEMQRHLQEPHFSGQPPKVRIFFSWFRGCFCELLLLNHERGTRLLQKLSQKESSPDTEEWRAQAPGRQGMRHAREQGHTAEHLGGASAPGHIQGQDGAGAGAGCGAADVGAAGEGFGAPRVRAMDSVRAAVSSVLGMDGELLNAQLDDRPNAAERLRERVGELVAALEGYMGEEQEVVLPRLVASWEGRDAAAAESVLQLEMASALVGAGMGFLGIASWLPWVSRSMGRWRTRESTLAFHDRLPWAAKALLDTAWEPLYLHFNWGLLQSMADPLEEDEAEEEEGGGLGQRMGLELPYDFSGRATRSEAGMRGPYDTTRWTWNWL